MEYLKRVAKALRESYWASAGASLKYAVQILIAIIVIGALTYGIDTLVQTLIKF